jgi:uncharacterized protein (TIGR04255 family)
MLDMPFPDSPRVIYKINPLEQVICQLAYPAILSIASEAPAKFQEVIRKEYPVYAEKLEGIPELLPEAGQQFPRELMKLLSISGTNRLYEFASADGNWTITLTTSSLALTARRYSRWEEFRAHLQSPFDALVSVYSPAFLSRIGLRYQDVIRRSALDLKDTSWLELIQPHIAGVLASPDMQDGSVKSTLSTVEIHLGDGHGLVRIVHGLAEAASNGEICYLIDSDYFTTQRTEIKDALTTLDFFNKQSGRLFRWCITEKLHQKMEPQSI